MTHKKSILLAAVFALVSTVTLGSGVLAHDGPDGHEHKVAATLTAEQKQQVEARKTALQEKFAAAKEARMNKLEDKRLATCEKRQAKINSILTKGTTQSQKHLAVFQKLEEKIKAFYVKKNLSSEGYDAAVAAADEKEAAAVAAIEASTETTFDCATADGAKPGDAVKELMKARHTALKEYRTAIKDLNLVVKKGHGKQQNADTSTETDTEGGEQ